MPDFKYCLSQPCSHKISLPFVHCHLRLSYLLQMTLKHLHWSHSCHNLRLPLMPFLSLLSERQGQAMDFSRDKPDDQAGAGKAVNKHAWPLLVRALNYVQFPPFQFRPSSPVLGSNLSSNFLSRFDTTSGLTVLFHEEWWWSNYCLKETFYLFKRKGSKQSLTTMKELIC